MEILAGISCLWDRISNSIADQASSEFAQIMCEAIKLEIAASCPEMLTEKIEKKEIEVIYNEEETHPRHYFSAFPSLQGIKISYEFQRRKSKTD